jgi:acetylornithine deacetylase/succinyl-diaminopimelate desuccinylase-like protein
MPTTSSYDRAAAAAWLRGVWDDSIVPELTTYIAIPNRSPLFDPDWEAHGHMERAVQHIARWCAERPLPGAHVEVARLPGRTPVIVIDVPATDPEARGTVLLYGHLDKQPEMEGWREDLGPWKPVRDGDRLYGRGGADDGYAAYASLAALEAVRRHGGRHARALVLIEASEESGSPDLPAHLEALAERIGTPDLVVCLDSGCGDFERLWVTTSLRGIVVGTLTVRILREGVHSGDAGGVVPSSFRIARQLLSRLEDETDGRILLDGLHAPIPADRREQAERAGQVLGAVMAKRFPFVAGATAPPRSPAERVLDRTWRPAVEVTGAEGLPALASAGNVLRPTTRLRLSLRLPPTVKAEAAARLVRTCLEADPPYGAEVRYEGAGGTGWQAPPTAPWLAAAADAASEAAFGAPATWMGEGGSIPFMAMLGDQFPAAQFVITGVLGPGTNAHGPNEFLHIPYATRLTGCVADLLDHHARRPAGAGA